MGNRTCVCSLETDPMKVFLSWSGGRSKSVAETLGTWISQVIQAVDPWISSAIEKGVRWQAEIADRLEEAKVGIICLTSSNLTEPWILFEAGALSKAKESYVCTFLLDVGAADIEPPLGQFQHTIFTKADVFKLVQTINRSVQENGERGLTDQTLNGVFEKFWPELEASLNKIIAEKEEKPAQRPSRALLEEILAIVREQQQRRIIDGRQRIDVRLRRPSSKLRAEDPAHPHELRTLTVAELDAIRRTLADDIVVPEESAELSES